MDDKNYMGGESSLMDTSVQKQMEDELAAGYVANKKLSLRICAEFTCEDGDAWSELATD